jgi:hypothetical protein
MPYDKRFDTTLYNRDWLYKVYVEENRNAGQVARLLGCDRGAVLRWLRKLDIPVKSTSEACKLAPHPGSHSSRLRKKFWTTLHDEGWLKDAYVTRGLSASEIAREVGASVPATIEALQRAGIYVRGISRAKIGKPRGFRPDEEVTEQALRARARRSFAEGPCALCGAVGQEVNHKDRNPRHYNQDNLEMLCKKCHAHQHAMELQVLIDRLARTGSSYLDVHNEARTRILSERSSN